MKTSDSATSDISHMHRMEYEALPDVVVSAPGIVRLLGEHTSDADGLFLAFPFDKRLSIALSSRRDSSVRFFAADINERKRTNLSNLRYKREDRWANAVKAALAAFLDGGARSKGFNITISGTIPQGLGLGSSLALRCASAQAAAIAVGAGSSPMQLCQALVDIDKSYFDRESRVADYAPTVFAKAGTFSFVDARGGAPEQIPFDFDGLRLLLTDSKVPRSPSDTELRQRTDDCASGLAIMGGAPLGLRSFGVDDLEEYLGVMPERVRRHCTFYVEEVQRVREAREALLHGDLASFAKAVNKSQAGLRNNYELSCPEIDWLVKRALEIDGVLASRLIGKGYGGCTLSILDSQAMDKYKERLEEYDRIFGFKPGALEIFPGAGIMVH